MGAGEPINFHAPSVPSYPEKFSALLLTKLGPCQGSGAANLPGAESVAAVEGVKGGVGGWRTELSV